MIPRRTDGISRTMGGVMEDNSKTSYERVLNAKLEALSAATIVLLEVARAKISLGPDVRFLINKLEMEINAAWKEEE